MPIRSKQICLFILCASIACPTGVFPQAPPAKAQEGTVLRGAALNAEQKRIGFDFSEEQYKALVKSGLILQKSVVADRNATAIRVVAPAPASGATGTVTVPLVKLLGPTK